MTEQTDPADQAESIALQQFENRVYWASELRSGKHLQMQRSYGHWHQPHGPVCALGVGLRVLNEKDLLPMRITAGLRLQNALGRSALNNVVKMNDGGFPMRPQSFETIAGFIDQNTAAELGLEVLEQRLYERVEETTADDDQTEIPGTVKD